MQWQVLASSDLQTVPGTHVQPGCCANVLPGQDHILDMPGKRDRARVVSSWPKLGLDDGPTECNTTSTPPARPCDFTRLRSLAGTRWMAS